MSSGSGRSHRTTESATHHWEGDMRSRLKAEQTTTLPHLAHRSNQSTAFDVVMHARADGRRPPFKPDHTWHCHFSSRCALLDGSESNTSKQLKECHLPAPWGRAPHGYGRDEMGRCEPVATLCGEPNDAHTRGLSPSLGERLSRVAARSRIRGQLRLGATW
jgi:hypothetical protein